MSPVNPDRIDTFVVEAKKSLKLLMAYAAANPDELLASQEKLSSMKYQFVICAEVCLNLCQHISAKEFATVPDSYGECFSVLVRNGVLTREHGEQLRQLAGLRNTLLHLYWKRDDARVLKGLGELHVIESYLEIIWKRYGVKQ